LDAARISLQRSNAFGPPPYHEPRQDELEGAGYVFGRGELFGSRTVSIGPAVNFTEELVPIEPRTLPLLGR
jgi:hypothetical protein